MRYSGDALNEIIFPLGGIGTGSIGLGGNGRLIDWEIFNRPSKGSDNGFSHLAVRAETRDGVKAKVLCGDLTKEYMGHYRGGVYYQGYGFGPLGTTMAGFDHFRECEFDGEFPLARLHLRDSDFPAEACLTAFNPMIPNHARESSIPAAFFELALTNTQDEPLRFTAAMSLANPFEVSENRALPCGRGVFLRNAGADTGDVGYGDLTLAADATDAGRQVCWYRGGWQDGIATFWREFSSPQGLREREYETAGSRDTCTVWITREIPAGKTERFRFLVSWNVPNCYNYWLPLKDDAGRDVTWRNWYATQWKDSRESAKYAMDRWQSLYDGTLRFHDALWSVTAAPAVLDAAASSLSVLKSPTVLRLEDGSLYGWEGCHERAGSCEGSCTHVWNYAYALCFLFPELERSLRNLDYRYNLQPNGAMRFRMTLPVGRPGGWDMPCLDGQMGGVIKVYRDWKLCGDDGWLRAIWPSVKKSLEFAWSPENKLYWDADHDGVLEGRQHHTLDMELFGPSSWLEGFYLAALKAGAEMAEHLGETDSAAEYRELFRRGSQWTEDNLFNGRWYYQKVNLRDKSQLARYEGSYTALNRGQVTENYWNEETGQLKYQIGQGSEIDQIIGQWHAHLCGLGDVFDPEHRKAALRTLYTHNFRKTFRGFTNPWRNFILNDEAGAIICAYPEGAEKPAIPVPYCEETMHGFEYQLAGLLMAEGFVREGEEIAKGVRDRYDGKKRNPWNEIECGNNYARSMAAFGMLPILSGFRFDLPNRLVGFDPVEHKAPFRAFWSVDGAWGTAELTEQSLRLTVLDGALRANRIAVPFLKTVRSALVDGVSTAFTFENGIATLETDTLTGTVVLEG